MQRLPHSLHCLSWCWAMRLRAVVLARRFAARGGMWLALGLAMLSGCASPYRSDQGALFGGLLGAGTGALVGSAVGNAGAGAAIGAGVGAISGAAIGSELDEIEARNRAEIAQHLGRPVPAQPVAVDDIIAMSKAGVDENLIVNHIRAHGAAAPPSASDLILLQREGVSARVVAAMQEPPAPRAAVPVYGVPVYASPPVYAQPVYVQENYYGPHWRPYRCGPPCRPGVSWGVSVSGH